MMQWLCANYGTILVGGGLLAAVCASVRTVVRDKKAGRHSCCGDCAQCGHCHTAHTQPGPTGAGNSK